MAQDFTGWHSMPTQKVGLTLEEYQQMLANEAHQGSSGVPPLSYEQWLANERRAWGLPADANLTDYSLNSYTTDPGGGAGWGGQVGYQLMNNADGSVAKEDVWESKKTVTPTDILTTAAVLFGGSALGAHLAGAGAAGAGAGAGAAGTGAAGAGGAGGAGLFGAEGIGGAIMSGAGGAAAGSAVPGLGALGSAGLATSTLAPVFISGKAAAPSILPSLLGGAGALSQIPAAFEPVDIPDYNPEPLQEVPNFELPNIPPAAGFPAASSGLLDGIKNTLKPISDAVGGGSNLAGIVGAIAGAADSGGTQTSSRDPWGAAQPFLKNLLGDADAMRAGFAANPYTPQQTQAYQNAYSGLDQARSALPGLLSWGQGAMQRQNSTPSYEQLFGSGLLSPRQPQQPTAQAGGPGGLLMDPRWTR